MLKQLAAVAALLLAPMPAHAQDGGEIARVQAGQDCVNCNLFQADLAYRDLAGLDVSASRLRQADLSLSTLNNADFTGTNLSIANMFGARLTSASLRNANLERAVLVGAYLGGADLSGARLDGANLSGADLRTTRGLTQAQLDSACGDASTRLPDDVSVPQCP